MARFTNQAQLRYGRSIANSNIAVGEILEVLSAAKEAVRNTYRQNDTITYVISIVNAGTLAYTGLTITDNLGAYPYNTTTLVPLDYMEGTAKYYINGVLQPAPAVTAGPPLVINGITVPAGGNAVIVYEAEVNPYAPLAATGCFVVCVICSGHKCCSIIAYRYVGKNRIERIDDLCCCGCIRGSISGVLNEERIGQRSIFRYRNRADRFRDI
jgi:uncharacterized repeat protein (TIGR01451 family)